jgi:Na+-driven multidrug efflux pump
MTDTMMVGALGEVPLSGASLANQFIMVFQICCMGIGMGASVLTSRFWGMKNHLALKKNHYHYVTDLSGFRAVLFAGDLVCP